jgi:uncharacterized membrane protein
MRDPASFRDESTNEADTRAQGLRVLTALVWILWGLKLYQPTFVVAGAPEVGFLYTVLGVSALAVILAPLPVRWARRVDFVLLIGALLAIVLWTLVTVNGSPAYGTDEVAFDQGSAQLLLSGQNPYGADLTWTFDAFRVLPSGTTNTLDGSFVHTLSYPAGSFLVYLPILAIGIHTQAAIYVDALFWVVGMALLWWLLPRPARPLVPLLASLGIYVDYVTGGVTDSLMMPFLVLALWRWDRFDQDDERSAARWIGPIALGLACTIKQAAWFVAPVLIIGIALEHAGRRHGWRSVAKYVVLAGIAFLIPNLPFIVWDGPTWFQAVMLPFFEPLVPFGQGFVAFSTTFFQGGGALSSYTAAGAAAMVAVLLAVVGWYPALKRVLPALPLLALLLPTRSLNSYFVYAIPGILIALATVRPARTSAIPTRTVKRTARAGTALAAGISIIALGHALLTPAPLQIVPVDEHTTGSLQTVDRITVIATNRSDRPLTPHFAVALGPYMSSYWLIDVGPEVLEANTSATYVLLAPNTASMPTVSQASVVFGLTPEPATISAARLFPAVEEGTQITPQAVNRLVDYPESVEFTVQLVDRVNGPIRRAGVEITLGQILYTSDGLFPGQASINGRPEGQSPVSALTDPDGVARFEVTAVQQQPFEIFFQAWVPAPFPHGYSSSVAVHFRGAPP